MWTTEQNTTTINPSTRPYLQGLNTPGKSTFDEQRFARYIAPLPLIQNRQHYDRATATEAMLDNNRALGIEKLP